MAAISCMSIWILFHAVFFEGPESVKYKSPSISFAMQNEAQSKEALIDLHFHEIGTVPRQ